MRQTLITTGSILLFGLLLNSCDNSVDVNADWEEITIVYGILDPSDTTHRIKVNKAFLNKNRDAREIAKQEEDSIYHNHPIRVRLQELNNGGIKNEVTFNKTNLQTKKPGLFPHPDNVIYQGKMELNPDNQYRVVVDSLNKNKRASATTPLVGDFNLEKPQSRVPGQPATLFFAEGNDVIFDGTFGRNAFFYKFKLLMTFSNIKNGKASPDTFSWEFFPRRVKQGNKRQDFDYELESDKFFNTIIARLSSKADDLKRPIDSLETQVLITGGAEDIFNYIRVNEPSISIVQTKPEYSNINNGRGVFSSRRKTNYNMVLSGDTKDSLTRIDNLHFTR